MGGRSFIGDTVNVTFSACVPERWSCRFRVRMDFRGFLSQTWRCMLDQRRGKDNDMARHLLQTFDSVHGHCEGSKELFGQDGVALPVVALGRRHDY